MGIVRNKQTQVKDRNGSRDFTQYEIQKCSKYMKNTNIISNQGNTN